MFAARFEDAPAVWGVGRVLVDGQVQPWPVSQADIDDEAAAMAPRLAALGIGDSDLVLLVSLLSQAIHVVPLEQAAGRLGARYSSADATPFDAFRTVSLVRRLRPSVVVGIDRRVCEGFAALGHEVADVFAGVGAVVAADRGAAQQLVAAGRAPHRWVRLGPTSALSGPEPDVLRYDATRWRLDEDGEGQLLITNVAPRLTGCERLATGVRGRVREPGAVTLAD
jgi:hypothetical protein